MQLKTAPTNQWFDCCNRIGFIIDNWMYKRSVLIWNAMSTKTQKGKIKLPITEDTMVSLTMYLAAHFALIGYFFTPLYSFTQGLSQWGELIINGGYILTTFAMLFSPLFLNNYIEYSPEPNRPIHFRKKVRINYRLIYLSTLLIPGVCIVFAIKHRPHIFDFLERIPALIALLLFTNLIALWVYFQTVLEKRLKAKFNFIGFFQSKWSLSKGNIVNEHGIFWESPKLHIAWGDIDMITAEVTLIDPDEMLLDASIHIHYHGGQMLSVDVGSDDYVEVFEGICAAYQLHNAQAQLTNLFYEEQNGSCTKLWQRQ